MILFNDLATQQARIRISLDRRIETVLSHGQYICGPEVAELEERISRRMGGAHVVTCSNGTDALALALRALDIGPGDAVFVPSLTFVASAGAIVQVGAAPVFVDVDPDCYTICPTDLATRIRSIKTGSSLRPRAVIAVDLFGVPANYAALHKVTDAFGLDLVADAAHSFGSCQAGQDVGRLARLTSFSFYPGKALGCYGDGGAVTTTDEALAHRLRCIRWHGTSPDHREFLIPGVNSRLDTIQAAILLSKLDIYDDEMKSRKALAKLYARLLPDLVKGQSCPADSESNIGYYVVETSAREAMKHALEANGIQSMVYYKEPIHVTSAFSEYHHGGELRYTDHLSKRLLALPMHPYLCEDDIERIASVIGDALQPV